MVPERAAARHFRFSMIIRLANPGRPALDRPAKRAASANSAGANGQRSFIEGRANLEESRRVSLSSIAIASIAETQSITQELSCPCSETCRDSLHCSSPSIRRADTRQTRRRRIFGWRKKIPDLNEDPKLAEDPIARSPDRPIARYHGRWRRRR